MPSETARAYLETLRDYVLTHGRPLAFYSDRHGIFRINAKDAESGDGKTEFGRVVERSGIASIQASTPQARGRVERSNHTLQDRLERKPVLFRTDEAAHDNHLGVAMGAAVVRVSRKRRDHPIHARER